MATVGDSFYRLDKGSADVVCVRHDDPAELSAFEVPAVPRPASGFRDLASYPVASG